MRTIWLSALLLASSIGALAQTGSSQSDASPKPDSSQRKDPAKLQAPNHQAFIQHWHQGKAEISRFALTESRYGAGRAGNAILVFVTEGFSPSKQVKSDGPGSVQVLKLNTIKKFATGVYDYSLMSSVFTPIDATAFPRSLKLTASVQEWCGQIYDQLNLRGGKFMLRGHSYFDGEGDRQRELPVALLEDEIWTWIRLRPQTLPTGTLKMIPGVFDARLRHKSLTPQTVTATLTPRAADNSAGQPLPPRYRYLVSYPRGRSLAIEFEAAFPHRILSWREDLGGGRVTTAVRTHVVQMAYWNHGGLRDAGLRARLGLPPPPSAGGR